MSRFINFTIRHCLSRLDLRPSRLQWMIFTLAFAAIGSTFLFAARAATANNTFSVSPQSGTIAGNASLVTNSSAVDGQAVEFGSNPPSSTGSTTSGCMVNNTVAPCMNDSSSGIGASGWGTPIFDDEFNGTSLNTSKWSTGWFSSGITGGVSSTEDDCYDPAQVVVKNGELDLNLIAKKETCDGSTKNYATGFITSDGKFQYTYGFAEARIWLPGTTSIADWPSFWQDGQNWPTDGELDVLEGLGGQPCGHWHGPTNDGVGYGPNGGSGCVSGTWTGSWHTFAADWEPGMVTWYYDGHSIGCVKSSGSGCGGTSSNSTITSSAEYLILGMGIGTPSGNGTPATAPDSQRIDYVRVWQR